MSIERIVLAVAGFMVILSVVLSQVHHIYWIYFTAFVGFNLLQSAFTGWCPLAKILKVTGGKTGTAFS